MKRKDEFLRAIQMVRHRHGCDRQLAFGWALNLRERSIPPDIHRAARRFIIRISR
jgi:hypothetical protein